MAYVEKYRIEFRDGEELKYSCRIYEDGYSGDLIYLKGTGTPVVYRQIDNEEDPYLPIQSSELNINILSEGNFSLLELFMSGAISDVKYQVKLYTETPSPFMVWVGFLDTESCNEDIEDDPREVTLRAVDGLGFLRNEGFTDHDTLFQYGKYTLLQCIEWCMGKTQLPLDLYIGVSIYEESMETRTDNPTAEPFSQCKVHTRSLKGKNCYDVMYAICEAFGASLYQALGFWRIDRKHDRWNDRLHTETVLAYPYTESEPSSRAFTYRTTDFVPIERSHKRYFLPPYKQCKTTYDYIVPEDIPRNSNFQEGTYQPLLSDADNNAYTIDHWDYVKNLPEVPTSSTPIRNDEFDPVSDKLIESTVRLPRDGSGTPGGNNRLRAEAVEINKGDRVNISAETRARFSYDSSTQVVGVFRVYIVADSTNVYTLRENAEGEPAQWISGTGALFQSQWPDDTDATTWNTVAVRSDPFPEDGLLYIELMTWDGFVTSNETWYKNVKVSFELFMGASTNLTGEEAQINQTSTYRGEGEFKITLGDSPKKIISGALFRETDDTQLTTVWTQQGFAEDPVRLLVLTNRAHFQLQCRFKTRVEGIILGISYPNVHESVTTAILAPNIEMVYAPTTMSGTKYIPTNIKNDFGDGTGQIVLMEFYNQDEEENPLGDSETLTYLYG